MTPRVKIMGFCLFLLFFPALFPVSRAGQAQAAPPGPVQARATSMAMFDGKTSDEPDSQRDRDSDSDLDGWFLNTSDESESESDSDSDSSSDSDSDSDSDSEQEPQERDSTGKVCLGPKKEKSFLHFHQKQHTNNDKEMSTVSPASPPSCEPAASPPSCEPAASTPSPPAGPAASESSASLCTSRCVINDPLHRRRPEANTSDTDSAPSPSREKPGPAPQESTRPTGTAKVCWFDKHGNPFA